MGTNNTVLGPRLCFWTWWESRSPWGVIWSEIMNGLMHHTKKLRLSPMEQHERDTVGSAPWNNCHVVGEWDGDAGDKKKKRKNQKWGWCGGIKRWWGSEPGRTMGLRWLEGLGRQIRGLLHRLLWFYPSEKPLIANKRPCLGTRTSVRLLLLAWDSMVKRNVVSEKQILTYTQSLLFMRFFFMCIICHHRSPRKHTLFICKIMFLFFWLLKKL